jgi:hypothetical protein
VSWHKPAATAILLQCDWRKAPCTHGPLEFVGNLLIYFKDRLRAVATAGAPVRNGPRMERYAPLRLFGQTRPRRIDVIVRRQPKSPQRGAKSPNPLALHHSQSRNPIQASACQGPQSSAKDFSRCLVKLRPETCTLAGLLQAAPAEPAIGHSLHFILLILAPEPIARHVPGCERKQTPQLSELGSAVGASSRRPVANPH